MSYIDLFKHEYVGSVIGGIAVYVANEDINGDEFCAKKGQFILGGGGGEHPGAVVRDISDAVESYLDFTEQIDLDWERMFDLRDTPLITFHNWDIKTSYDFYKSCLENGYSKDDGYVELWVVNEIAKLAIEKRPDCIKQEILDLISN